jgi:hypothetical protein
MCITIEVATATAKSTTWFGPSIIIAVEQSAHEVTPCSSLYYINI